MRSWRASGGYAGRISSVRCCWRRAFPRAPSHKLGALVDYAGLPVAGRYHRALADAQMAASLLLRIAQELRQAHGVDEVSVDLLRRVQRVPKQKLPDFLARVRG